MGPLGHCLLHRQMAQTGAHWGTVYWTDRSTLATVQREGTDRGPLGHCLLYRERAQTWDHWGTVYCTDRSTLGHCLLYRQRAQTGAHWGTLYIDKISPVPRVRVNVNLI